MNTVLAAISAVVNGVALLGMIGVLWLALRWRRTVKLPGLALSVLVVTEIVLISINLVILVVERASPLDQHTLQLLAVLGVDVLALVVIVGFIAMTVFAGVLGQALAVMVRAALVLWGLLQWPLWQGEVMTLYYQATTGLWIETHTSAGLFMVLLLVLYVVLTWGLVIYYRQQLRQFWLVAGVVVLQLGHLVPVLLPALHRASLVTWMAVPAFMLFGMGLRRAEQAAVSDVVPPSSGVE